MQVAVTREERSAHSTQGPARGTVVLDESAMRSALESHLRRELGSEVAIDGFERKSSGFSWITYSFVAKVTARTPRKLILRLGPPNGLFAPYSVIPQVNALRSLNGTRIPVPELVSFDQEGAEFGCPFFVCEHVEGDAPMPWAGSKLDEEHRRDIAGQFIAILGELHRFDWRGTQLVSLHVGSGERDEVRAVAGWRASLARPTARYYPLLDWGGRWLLENCPTPPHRTIVHGDYRIGNFLERDKRITAILDWELVHLGDPHEDLAWALLPTFNGRSKKLYGVLEREEGIDRYQRASGVQISAKSLAYYEVFSLYQAAAIQMRAVRAFEVDRFNDMRMAVMASQMASIVRAFDRALEAAA